jgi:hypothetical protein
MNFRKVNNITGWAVFLIALATYMFTREARGSLWDCGEFVSSAYKMELPHPPGAPMFTILGRFFIILFGDKGMTAANAVNFMSAMASAATILFLFWSVTHFARKMFVNVGEQLTSQQLFTTMSAGVVGALAYTFSDSFWFSAVEGEVYALSSFFTALVFWAMLKWEHADEHAGKDVAARARADRWIIFLFFMMGLSIGVHLLNLLSIPAIVMIYYFRRYFKSEPFKADAAIFQKDSVLIWTAVASFGIALLLVIANMLNKESDLAGIAMILAFIGAVTILIRIYSKYKAIRNIISAFIVGCLITGVVQVGVIQYSMKAAGLFDVFFVNSMGLPFFSGFTFYFIALTALIIWVFRFHEKNISRARMITWFILFLILSTLPFIVSVGEDGIKFLKFILVGGVAVLIGYFFKSGGLRILKLSLWCYAFIMLGYFLYFTVLIRSNSNPAIDMNNVDNPINLVYYLSREQYGSAPLAYGPHFDAQPNDIDSSGEIKYIKGQNRYISIGHSKEYAYPASDKQFFPRIWDPSNDQGHKTFYIQWLQLQQSQNSEGKAQYIPTYADNAEWFFTYQMNLMYWRYFMWNFAGKQNDVQGLGNVRDGNWISGISFLDNNRLGDQSKMPDSLKHNKANNKLYMLPFILGILGCVYQFLRNRRDWAVNFLLFFMTGIAVVIYLNQPGNQPRERDYAYVGSFYAFAIWIGLSVVALVKMASQKTDKKGFTNILISGSVLTFVIAILSSLRGSFGGILFTGLFIALLFALVTAGITYLVRAVSSGGQNSRSMNIAATIICLIAPLLMAQQEWDDHDRSQKTVAPDLAKDYLESCERNAVLFTFGDNDTYPLWYAQEVEHVRPDIRIINYSLLGIDWYINQLRYKINESDSLDVIWTPQQMEGGKRDFVVYSPKPGFDANAYYELYGLMKNYIGSDDPEKLDYTRGEPLNSYPVSKVSVPVDRDLVIKNKTVNPGDSIVKEMRFDIRQKSLQKNDLAILNILAANNWKRPIYFTSPFDNLGFGQYLRKDGMTFRLVPVITKDPRSNWVFETAMDEQEKKYGGSLASRQIWDNNDDVMYKNLSEKFQFGGANKRGTYFDEENRRHLLNIRSVFGEAAGNLADEGKLEEAKKLIDKAEAGMLPENIPYGMTSRYNNHNQTGLVYLEACYKAGKPELAEKVRLDIRKDLQQQKSYYEYLRTEKPDFFTGSFQNSEYIFNDVTLAILDAIEKKYAPEKQPKTTIENPQPPITTSIKPDSAKMLDSMKKLDSLNKANNMKPKR